ncbi:MAG: DUF4446 family protein [Candidatus Moraniibacteriota bacterium]
MDFTGLSSVSGFQWMLFALAFGAEVFLCITLFFLWRKGNALEKKLEIFFGGKEAKDLEVVLLQQKEDMRVFDKEIQELFEISNRLYRLGLQSIHKVEVIRFNPFKEVGSNQSFCVALMNGKDSGVVLSSIHTREGTRVYAKPVASGVEAGHQFTDEEREAIALASKQDPEA